MAHGCYDPNKLIEHYPRDGRELRSAFHKWQPRDTISWFEARGVPLKTEPDGRIFPVANDSIKIVHCPRQAASDAGVQFRPRLGVRAIKHVEGHNTACFQVTLTDGSVAECDRVLRATGGNRTSVGPAIAESLSHTIKPPSLLFSLSISTPRSLMGSQTSAFQTSH